MENVDSRIRMLLDGLHEAFERRSWQGTNLTGSLRGVPAWAADVRLLVAQHRRLSEAVEALEPKTLARPMAKSLNTPAFVVRGIAARDLYHAWQIQLLKRLHKGR